MEGDRGRERRSMRRDRERKLPKCAACQSRFLVIFSSVSVLDLCGEVGMVICEALRSIVVFWLSAFRGMGSRGGKHSYIIHGT